MYPDPTRKVHATNGQPGCWWLDFGGEVGELHEGDVVLDNEDAVFFGFGFECDPFGIFAEFCPAFAGSFAALVAEQIDEGAACERVFCGNPKRNVVHTEAFENLRFFGAEALEDEVLLALVEVVDAEFVDGVGSDFSGRLA